MFVFGHILIVSFLFLHSVQNASSNSEFSQGRQSSALRGRLKDLAILNDDNPASTTNIMQQLAVRFEVCSTDNCQFKEDLPLFSKRDQSSASSLDEEGLQFATTFTMSDIEQLVGLLENRKRSIYVGEQTQQPSEYAELLRRLSGFKHKEFKIEHPFPYFDMFMTIMCVSFAALAAGLTMGMMSIDPLLLKVKLRGGTELEKEQAKKIYPLIQNHHRLLVTLLLMNSLANEMLPLFLDNMLPRFAAIILSVTLVLFFGEIIPSAVFTGPDQIKIAASLCPLVRFFMFALCIISFPIAKLLDYVLGHSEDSIVEFKRGELKSLVQFMYREKKTGYDATADNVQNSPDEKNASKGNFQNAYQENGISGGTPSWDIEDDEINVIEGVLSMKTMTAGETFQPLNDVFAIERNDVLNEEKVKQIYDSGFSRIPVYEESKENICGIILTRELILNTLSDEKITALCVQKTPICVSSERNLIDLLNVFRLGRSKDIVHMAVVCNDVEVAENALLRGQSIPKEGGVVGIITLEDVIERMIRKEIFDETDDLNLPHVMSLSRRGSLNALNDVSSEGEISYELLSQDNEGHNNAARNHSENGTLCGYESKFLEGALSLKTKTVADILTPLGQVFAIDVCGELNKDNIKQIYATGYSRVPVYKGDKANICGVLFTKRLILIKEATAVASVVPRKPLLVSPVTNLIVLLKKFQEGKRHMAIVCNDVERAQVAFREDEPIPLDAGVLGVVTLEDVIEEIIQEKIYDEADIMKNWNDKQAVDEMRNSVRSASQKSLSHENETNESSPFLAEKNSSIQQQNYSSIFK